MAILNSAIATGRLEDRRKEKEESDDSENEQQHLSRKRLKDKRQPM